MQVPCARVRVTRQRAAVDPPSSRSLTFWATASASACAFSPSRSRF